MKFSYIIFILSLIIINEGISQKSFQPKKVDMDWKGVIYRKEHTGNLTIHTNGFSAAYNFGKLKTYYKTNYYHLEVGFIRDPREQSQNKNIPVSFSKTSQSFRFGKQNNMYVIRAGKGVKKLITDKARRKGIAVGYNYELGPSIAILRPYYLELIYNVQQPDRNVIELKVERYTSENADKFLEYNSIFGGDPGNRGWNQLSIVPGIQGKLSMFFSIGAFEEYAKSLEIGIMGDFYIKKIPLMVETEAVGNKPYFINFFATFEFGKRTN